jgi:hypothetical protein
VALQGAGEGGFPTAQGAVGEYVIVEPLQLEMRKPTRVVEKIVYLGFGSSPPPICDDKGGVVETLFFLTLSDFVV